MLKSGVIYFVGRFGAALVTFLAIAIYTRVLTPSQYGVYGMVQAGAAMAYAGLVQWLTFSLGRFMPQYRAREDVIRTHVASAYAVLALLVLMAAPFIVPRLASEEIPATAVGLGVGLFLAFGWSELTLIQFNMLGKPYLYTVFGFLRVSVATAVGVTLVVYAGWGAVGAIAGLLAGNLAIIIPNLVRYWRPLRLQLLERKLFREIASYGIPYAMSGAFVAVINVSDRYIIQWLLDTEAAGLYASPYDLAMRSLHVLMIIVAMATTPFIFRAYEHAGEAAADPLIRRQFEMLAAATLPIGIAFAMLSPAIVGTLLGSAFRESGAQLLPWVALATVLHGFQAAYLSLAFSLPKKPLRQTTIFALGALVNVVLNFQLIPHLGLIGAALATVIAFLLIVVLSYFVGRRLYRLPLPLLGSAKIGFACAAWAAVLWPVAWQPFSGSLVAHVTAGLVLYALISCALDVAGTRQATLAVVSRLARRARIK